MPYDSPGHGLVMTSILSPFGVVSGMAVVLVCRQKESTKKYGAVDPTISTSAPRSC